MKKRLDTLLVERGLAPSREKAQALVMMGVVRSGERLLSKPGVAVSEELPLSLVARLPYVGRGGLKLAAGLDTFAIDVTGLVVADIGCGTGGFTDVVLQRGAARVYAIDVGRGQLHYRLRLDERVVVLEGVNARYPLALPEPVNLATVDVSFISLRKVLPALGEALAAQGQVVVLLKPQFEADRSSVGRGGVVRDPSVRLAVLTAFVDWCRGQGWEVLGSMESPVTGRAGNREFLVHLARL
ncbi:MAG: TlyA family RNA methyltransferase [Chloroflexi bacterium]|nr:TlyA family RNA methyltransferase [Chloroflexota bacterium]